MRVRGESMEVEVATGDGLRLRYTPCYPSIPFSNPFPLLCDVDTCSVMNTESDATVVL